MNRIAGLLPISWSNSVFLSNTEFNYTCSCRINFNYPPFNKSGIGSDPYGRNITFSHCYLPYLAEIGATASYRAAGS